MKTINNNLKKIIGGQPLHCNADDSSILLTADNSIDTSIFKFFKECLLEGGNVGVITRILFNQDLNVAICLAGVGVGLCSGYYISEIIRSKAGIAFNSGCIKDNKNQTDSNS